MVHRVESVVERPPVQKAPREVACSVWTSGVDVTAIVLQHVDGHDALRCEKAWKLP